MKIPITKPYFGEEERALIQRPLETGWVVQGPYVKEFEDKFAAYTGASYTIATSSCTTALHLGLVALGVGPGDEVILPSFTWVATANVVEMQGAKPVFVDIDLDTFNIDPSQIEAAITPHTKVIVPVSLFGLSAPLPEVIKIARKHGLKVVEDDACATGAWINGVHAGTQADIGCFSFHPRKAITTGEGGMVVTCDEKIADSVRSLRDHGASMSDLARHQGPRSYLLPEFNMVGYNYRMTDIQGALGSAQIERLVWVLEQRRRLASRYDELLSELDWLQTPVIPEGYQHGYQSYVTLFSPQTPALENVEALNAARNQLMDNLANAGIATRPGTHAVHMLGFYRHKYGIKPEDLPHAYMADQLSMALPLYVGMTEAEQDYVIQHLTEAEVA